MLIALLLINPFDDPEVDGSIITDTETIKDSDSKDGVDQDREIKENEIIPESSVAQSPKEGQEATSSPDDSSFDSQENAISPSSEAITSTEDKMDLNEGQTKIGPQKQMDRQTASELIKEQEAVAENQKEEKMVEDRENIAATTIADPVQQSELEESAKTQISETAIAEESSEEEQVDDANKKSIFDEIKKQEEEKEALAEVSSPKWSVGPSVAPVYFNSFGEGSPIHSNFVSNSKSGNVNLSYGVAVSYELTNKLSVRSGLHRVDYGYNTDDITFSSSLVASTSSQITNISYTSTSRNLVVESSSNPVPTEEFVANDIIAQSPSRSGRMVQEFGYLEVPMELNYSLMDRKLNIDLIGGISSLFLVNNSVTLESSGSSTEMGQANNLNDVNFSTNIGLGVNYELTDKMKVHLEPMFKYQLNTFSDTEGNFQPYSLGIYTGMSFKF